MATAAASARIGISSIAAATSAGDRSMARSSADRTTRSASGSPSAPPVAGRSCSSMSAPMRLRMSMMARRVGFVLTPSSRSSASGWIAPATSQNAAAEDRTAPSRRPRPRPSGRRRAPCAAPSGSAPSSTATPRARSMRSVWSRVATASVTHVSPSADSAASRIADLTWALGTGVSYVIGVRSERPVIAIGRRVAPARPASFAPISRSGSTIRPIGRRRSEASPSSTTNRSARRARRASAGGSSRSCRSRGSPSGSTSASPPGEATR